VETYKIDAVVIAGDVFDTGTPPSYARELYNQLVLKLNQAKCQLLVLGGNHDAVATLNESKALLAQLNTQVIANTQASIQDQVIVLKDKSGEAGAIVCAIPFIRPRDVLKSRAGESALSKKQNLGQAITKHYQGIYELADKKRAQIFEEDERWLPIIATGHLTALGVKSSESVRDIYIGNLEGFDANGFPPADYIALGHIHRPQIVAKKEHIRYCGSPIALSFDELGRAKQMLLVEFDTPAAQSELTPHITALEIPMFQPIAKLSCDLDSLVDDIAHLCQSCERKPNQEIWLQLEIDTQDYLSDLQKRVEDIVDDYPVKILQLRRKKGQRTQSFTTNQKETLSELSVQQVFSKRLSYENFDAPNQADRLTRIQAQFDEIYQAMCDNDRDSSKPHVEGEK
ncbi:MAG: exonuclease subunit SbcD, partial [Vibrio sp.]